MKDMSLFEIYHDRRYASMYCILERKERRYSVAAPLFSFIQVLSGNQRQIAERIMPRLEFSTKDTISSRRLDGATTSRIIFTAFVTLRSLR